MEKVTPAHLSVLLNGDRLGASKTSALSLLESEVSSFRGALDVELNNLDLRALNTRTQDFNALESRLLELMQGGTCAHAVPLQRRCTRCMTESKGRDVPFARSPPGYDCVAALLKELPKSSQRTKLERECDRISEALKRIAASMKPLAARLERARSREEKSVRSEAKKPRTASSPTSLTQIKRQGGLDADRLAASSKRLDAEIYGVSQSDLHTPRVRVAHDWVVSLESVPVSTNCLEILELLSTKCSAACGRDLNVAQLSLKCSKTGVVFRHSSYPLGEKFDLRGPRLFLEAPDEELDRVYSKCLALKLNSMKAAKSLELIVHSKRIQEALASYKATGGVLIVAQPLGGSLIALESLLWTLWGCSSLRVLDLCIMSTSLDGLVCDALQSLKCLESLRLHSKPHHGWRVSPSFFHALPTTLQTLRLRGWDLTNLDKVTVHAMRDAFQRLVNLLELDLSDCFPTMLTTTSPDLREEVFEVVLAAAARPSLRVEGCEFPSSECEQRVFQYCQQNNKVNFSENVSMRVSVGV